MKSLRVKFLIFIISLLAVVLLFLSYVPLATSRDAIIKEKQTALTNQGTSAASALSRLDSLTAENVSEVLRLLDMTGYSRIIVTDAAGRVVYDTAGTTGEMTDIEDILTCLTGKTAFRSDYTSGMFESSYATPLSKQSEITGALYLSETDTEHASLIEDAQRDVTVLALILCAAVLVISVVVIISLLRRISALSSSMKIVADGDYSYRHSTKGQDELSVLGEEFNKLTARLQDTEQQRRRFVADASHELKTPLASIKLLSDSIVQSNGMDEDTMREFVSDISSEANRLQRTTEKLLDLSRLDDDIRVAPEPVDVKQVALDAVATIAPIAAEKSVKLHCSLEDGCVVMATTDDIYHIIFNLMENAVKYNVAGGTVEIELRQDDANVSLTVKDTGIGIPEEERLNVFSRFYRIDKARSREAGGSGLGLSIVHDAVKAHGGTITVGANAPQGTVFTVTLPRPNEDETGI